MSKKLPLILLILLISTQHVFISLSGKQSPAMFIFGDSYFDPGNNNYINTTTLDQANFRPYGNSYFNHPTGRFSDGRLISDFIAEHAKLPLIPPYLEPSRDYTLQNYHGVNFASGGAGVLSETFQGMVIDLRTQLKYYKKEVVELAKKTGHAEAARISSNAVYLFSIGTNDYLSPFLLNSTILASYSHSKYVEMVIKNLSTIVEDIYTRGGRKFVFLNLGELGCLPGLRILRPETDVDGCLEEASDLAKLHNKALKKMLSKKEQQLHGFQYFLYDYKSNLAQKITHPSKYGFKEGTKACCGSGNFNGVYSCGRTKLYNYFNLCERPSEIVFWDSYHLTERVYKQMADQMWSTGTLKKLFLCF